MPLDFHTSVTRLNEHAGLWLPFSQCGVSVVTPFLGSVGQSMAFLATPRPFPLQLGVGKDRRLLCSPAAKFFKGNEDFWLAGRELSHLFF